MRGALDSEWALWQTERMPHGKGRSSRRSLCAVFALADTPAFHAV
jgi:hypothetical protein